MSIAALATNYKMAPKKVAKIKEGWEKPIEGKVMVNVDGDSMRMWDVVAQAPSSETQDVLAAAHTFIPHVVNAQMAETYTLKEGLMLAPHIGCNPLIIPSDCMEVVETMKNEGFSGTSAATLYNLYNECSTVCRRFQEF